MKKIFNILIFGIMGLALSLPLAAFAIPPFPMNFTGSVTINGEPAPKGSVIQVYGDIIGDADSSSVVVADFTLTEAGVYGGARILAESAKVSIPQYTGDLTFRITSAEYDSGVQLADVSNIYTVGFSDFKDVDKTLTFTGATATAVQSIAVTPATPSIVAGATQQFTATGTYADASTANVTSSCTWVSGTTGTATIGSNTGLATGVAKGNSTITATYTGLTPDTATLTVSVSIPTGLSASATSTSQINLSWTAMTGATSYKVYRDGSNVASPTTNSYSDTGLTAGTTYSYTVSAVNSDGETSQSSSASATTQSAGGTVPPGGGGGTPTTTTTPSVTMPTTTTGTVTTTAAGGGKTTLTTAENTEVSVRLPVNAVSADTDVSVEAVSTSATTVATAIAAVLSGKSIVGGYVYDITATSGGAAITTFEKYVTVTLTYKTAQIAGLKESTLAINYWDDAATKWTALDTTVYRATNTLTAKTLHFTYFAIIGEEGVDVIVPVSEMTTAEIKARIAEITALIAQLQAQLNELLGISIEGCTITSFDRTLKKGMSGNDVKCLQIILNSASDTRVAQTGVGSSGNETNYFGSLTKAAVIKFQEKYVTDVLAPWNLTSGTGLVGSTTRDKLNSLLTP